MANEKVKPTERELGLAGTIENLVDTFEVAVASRDALADTLESLVKIIRKSNDGSRSLIESANEEIAAKYPELFSVEDGELVVAEPEDSEDSEDSEFLGLQIPPLIFGQWVKVKKPAKNESKNINWHHCMDRFDGKIMQVSSVYSMVGSQSDTLQWCVKLEGADGDRSLGEPCVIRWSFDPAWLTPLPDLPEGWRYLQPEELVAEGDEFCGLDWVNKRGSWSISDNVGRKQADTAVYRRRIVAEAPAKVAEALEPKQAKEIQPGTKVKILHPDCLGRTGTTSWENCPIPNCLFVWVDSEDPVLRVGAIPVHKRYLAPLS